MIKRIFGYFSKGELLLWGISVTLVIGSFCVFGGNGILTLAASLIGVTSILINAKGNPLGQCLMILFSLLYGMISYTFSYYGEMLTYLGMTLPMAVFALISWLKHPYRGKRSEVAIHMIGKKEILLLFPAATAVTVAFFFLLRHLNTANLLPSTISVTTSFLAVWLTFRRSPYFSLAYAANDIVLIVLWLLASMSDRRYLSVVFCFVAFLLNDIYGFISWQRMKVRQQQHD